MFGSQIRQDLELEVVQAINDVAPAPKAKKEETVVAEEKTEKEEEKKAPESPAESSEPVEASKSLDELLKEGKSAEKSEKKGK
jgi:hypothetical protein